MKITVFHPYMSGSGGGERLASKVCHHLAESHEVTVYGLWGVEGVGVPEWWRGLDVRKAWSHMKTPVLRRTINEVLTLFKTPHLEPGSDLFIGFGPHGAALAGRVSDEIPTIGYFFHPWYLLYSRDIDREPSSFFTRLLFRNYFFTPWLKAVDRRQVTKVVELATLSPHIAERIQRAYGRRPRVMMPACDPQFLAPQVETRYRNYIFLPSRIIWHKNIHTAVIALAVLRSYGEDVNLVICGAVNDEMYARSLHNLISRLNLDDHVFILGFVPDEELQVLYRNAVCHWFMALNEDFGLTPLESMMQETPVIGANDGGASYTIRDGVTGFLVPPKDAYAYAHKTLNLLRDLDLRAEMGIAGREEALEHWTWRRHFKKWDQLIRETVG